MHAPKLSPAYLHKPPTTTDCRLPNQPSPSNQPATWSFSMRPLLAFICFLAIYLAAGAAHAGHPFLCCDHNGGKVVVDSAEGKIEWEYPCKNPQDCWKLPSGNYLFCFVSGALEVTPAKQTV